MLLLSTIGLVVPAVFHWLSRGVPDAPELKLDTEIAVVLFVSYWVEPRLHAQDAPGTVRPSAHER